MNMMITPVKEISIDGDFSDWKDVISYRDSNTDQINANINIVDYRTRLDNPTTITCYLEVEGAILKDDVIVDEQGSESYGIGFIHIFIDEDKNPDTGYAIDRLGADLMIEISGYESEVKSSNLKIFDGDHAQDDWNGWKMSHAVGAIGKDNKLETQISVFINSMTENVDVYFHIIDSNGNEDFSDGILNSVETGSLIVTQRNIAADILTNDIENILELELTARGSDITVTSIDISELGEGVLVDISTPIW